MWSWKTWGGSITWSSTEISFVSAGSMGRIVRAFLRLTRRRRPAILRHVPKYRRDLDQVFRALGDGSRRAMVERLARGPASVSELARPFDFSMPTVVQHL